MPTSKPSSSFSGWWYEYSWGEDELQLVKKNIERIAMQNRFLSKDNRFSGNCRGFATYGGALYEKAIAFKVKINALKQVLDVKNAIAAAFEHLDLVVETFNKATAITMNEEI